MDSAFILSVIQTVSLLLGILVAVFALKKQGEDKTVAITTMQVDIKYIKEKIDNLDSLRDTATSAKNSASSAHKRLDDHLRLEHGKDIPPRA